MPANGCSLRHALLRCAPSQATLCGLAGRLADRARKDSDQPVPGFYQTSVANARGADTREFDLAVARKLPCSFDREYAEEQIWKSFTKFIRAVIPVAEANTSTLLTLVVVPVVYTFLEDAGARLVQLWAVKANVRVAEAKG